MSAPLRRRFYFPNDFLDGLSIEFEDGGAITTNSTQSLHPDGCGVVTWALNRQAPGIAKKAGGAPAPKPV